MSFIQILHRKKVCANKKYRDLEEEWNRLQQLQLVLTHVQDIEPSSTVMLFKRQSNELIRGWGSKKLNKRTKVSNSRRCKGKPPR